MTLSAPSFERRFPLRRALLLAAVVGAAAGCAPAATGTAPRRPAPGAAADQDPRVGLQAGMMDAEQALWNLRLLSATPPPRDFIGVTNSDLAFTGNYAIQGNYNGFQVWDISNPRQPTLAIGYVCPASQSDVSVYRNLLFVSGEGLSGRLDCGTQGVAEAVSPDRLRGLRIFDISDLQNPRNVANVQTCRGSHTHTVLVDPDDAENIYVYISGSAGVRAEAELPGCSAAPPEEDPNSALFRIEVIRVPLADPSRAEIVSSPRIFAGLVAPPRHGLAPEDQPSRRRERPAREGPQPGPTQCHDITVYPAIGLAGGACEGYGFLIDISDPVDPKRLTAVADSNFSYWHSATFNNDGTKLLFSDEWGGGNDAKCRATDPKEWGANAIFTVENGRELRFGSYYKLPAPQTPLENCVAHNGSLIPIPGRDVMVQGWYQGGISVFDFTDATRPFEIAFFDRGPSDATRMGDGGSWSAYWYNGVIVSSEIARGLDILELVPSEHISQNEIDAAKSVRLEYLNTQGQPQFVWPATFALARAYLDQLERSNGLAPARIAAVRQALTGAEQSSGGARSTALTALATQLAGEAAGANDAAKVRLLAEAVRALATAP